MRGIAEILGDPHILICECSECSSRVSKDPLQPTRHEHEHQELGPPFPSIEDLEHRENELAIDHPD